MREDAVPLGHVGARQSHAVLHLVGQALRQLVLQETQHLGEKGCFFGREVQIHGVVFVLSCVQCVQRVQRVYCVSCAQAV